MRYYSNDWVYTAGVANGEDDADDAPRTTGKTALANAITLLFPLLLIGLMHLLLGGKTDPKQATVLIISGNASGTGCVLTEDGYILTNRHVITDANKIQVVTGSGTSQQKTYDARLEKKGDASDSPPANASEFLKQLPNDYAILKIQAKSLPYFRLADDSYRPRSGAKVTAIGYGATMHAGSNAQGVAQDAPTGNISGFLPNESEQSLYLHTCPIQKGFSGGPLIEEHGRLIGINTASVPDDIGNNKQVAIPISVFRATLNAYTQGR